MASVEVVDSVAVQAVELEVVLAEAVALAAVQVVDWEVELEVVLVEAAALVVVPVVAVVLVVVVALEVVVVLE